MELCLSCTNPSICLINNLYFSFFFLQVNWQKTRCSKRQFRCPWNPHSNTTGLTQCLDQILLHVLFICVLYIINSSFVKCHIECIYVSQHYVCVAYCDLGVNVLMLNLQQIMLCPRLNNVMTAVIYVCLQLIMLCMQLILLILRLWMLCLCLMILFLQLLMQSSCFITRLVLIHWRANVKTWHHGTQSTLVRVMACCLMAPSHDLNYCWFIVNSDLENKMN